MVSHFAIPYRQYLGGHLPYVFTEYRALQLANVIKSDRATQVSIQIIEIFIKMRELISTNHEILSKLKKLEENDIERNEQINMIFMYIQEIENNKKQINDQQNRNRIGFNSSKNK